MLAIDSPDNLFHDGNQATAELGTILTSDWLNGVQSELLTVIAAAGLAPAEGAQLLQALRGVGVFQTGAVNDASEHAATNKFVLQQGRRVCTADLTLYVSTTGNDANDGLAPETAFLTLQAAFDHAVARYDFRGKALTIQLANGTYAGGLNASCALMNCLAMTIQGNTSNAASVVLQGGVVIYGMVSTGVNLQWLTAAYITARNNGYVILSGTIRLTGGAGSSLLQATMSSFISATAASIVFAGSGASAITAVYNSTVYLFGCTLSQAGAYTYTSFTCYASMCSTVYMLSGTTWSGSATGTRYQAARNGIIETNGGGASFIPGSVAGSVNGQGQYF